jgi:hypothetical protein
MRVVTVIPKKKGGPDRSSYGCCKFRGYHYFHHTTAVLVATAVVLNLGSRSTVLYHCEIANYILVNLVGFKFRDRIRTALASRITNPVLNSPGDHGNIVETGSRVILNLYRDPHT